MAFGQTVTNSQDENSCQKNNHCIDASVAASAEKGQVIENNGQVSRSDTSRDSSSSTHSAGASVSAGWGPFS